MSKTIKKFIYTVATGMFGSLVSCSTTLFTMVETVEGVELLRGATVVGVIVVGLMVVLTANFAINSFTTTVMLMAGWPAKSVVFTTEDMTGTVVFSSTHS